MQRENDLISFKFFYNPDCGSVGVDARYEN